MAPRGALDQLGQALSRIIHAFAEANDNAKIFMAKWDIKDGFWCMDCEKGEECNFAYVLPQKEGMPITLVVPTSLQMGWVESPPYFCAATEMARDIASDYCNRGCTEDFYKKKIFSNTFFSQCKLVDMVCHMKSHQGRFQKKSFSCVLCAFSRVFFLFYWEKCVFGWFS